jgi:PAS domain S-box-containing protein
MLTSDIAPSDSGLSVSPLGPRDAIFLLRPDGRIASWNPRAERLLGYSESEAMGRHVTWLYPMEQVQRGESERELRLATGSGCYEAKGWRLRKDHSSFRALMRIFAMRDAGGTTEGFLVITSPSTE